MYLGNQWLSWIFNANFNYVSYLEMIYVPHISSQDNVVKTINYTVLSFEDAGFLF